jgi:hypothetical protein
MTVPLQIPILRYTYAGASETFSFSWSSVDANDNYVNVNGVTQLEGFQYELMNYSKENGGNMVFYPDILKSGDSVVVYRRTPITQEVDYTQAPFEEETHEGQLDKDTYILQEMIFGNLTGVGPIDLDAVPGADYVDITNTAGTDARIPSWSCTEDLAGVFHGEVVEDGLAPADGDPTSRPDGYMWLELAP